MAVIGQTVANQLFPGMDPIGQTMRVRNLPFRVIGVLEVEGPDPVGQDQDDTLVMPYTTAMKKLLAISYIPTAYVSAAITRRDRCRRAADRRHAPRRVTTSAPGQPDDFTVRNLTDIANTAEDDHARDDDAAGRASPPFRCWWAASGS